MEPVQPKALLGLVELVLTHSVQAPIGGVEVHVVLVGVGVLKIVGPAEVILRPRAADGGVLTVPVQVEFDLPFAPPAVVVHAPGHVGAHILALALHPVQDGVHLLVGQGVHPAELGVEVGGVLGHLPQAVVHLVVVDHFRLGPVLQGDAAPLAEGHGPVAVEGAAGVDAHRQGGDLEVLLPAGAEEVAHRALHRGDLLIVPVKPDNGVAPAAGGGHPDVLDGAGTGDVRHGEGLPRGDAHKGVYFPALAQVPGRGPCAAVLQLAHGPAALSAGVVLRADGPALGIGETEQIFHRIGHTVIHSVIRSSLYGMVLLVL